MRETTQRATIRTVADAQGTAIHGARDPRLHRHEDGAPEDTMLYCEHHRLPAELEVLIEIPKGSFLKRGSTERIDFVSPLPCPYNYGCVPQYLGLEGDLLDALVLGPRLARGTRVRVKAWGAVTFTDRGMSDDKLVCAPNRPSELQCRRVLEFFRFYAFCKGLLNRWRARPGRNACEGWIEAGEALARARPRGQAWTGPSVEF
jgi:inorganic pyrophosphatase